jgi:hypothetical protein
MAMIDRMSRAERRTIARLGRKERKAETAMRYFIVAALGRGDSSPSVERMFEVARSTVVEVAKRFRAGGLAALRDRREGNGSRKVDARFERALIRLLQRSPEDFGWFRPTWTRELLVKQLVAEGLPQVSVTTLGRALAHVGARLGTPKPIVLCPWPRARRIERLAEIRRVEERATPYEPVLYVDEVDIHLNPKIGRDWMLPGTQRRLVTPGTNRKFYLAGGLDVLTGKLVTTGLDKKNSDLFIAFLKVVDRRYERARRIHLILDNYKIHSSTRTTAALRAYGDRFVLHFLPPYCPDANRIERVWQDLHANVTRNHRCRTLFALLARARCFVDAYQWRRIANTVSHEIMRAA